MKTRLGRRVVALLHCRGTESRQRPQRSSPILQLAPDGQTGPEQRAGRGVIALMQGERAGHPQRFGPQSRALVRRKVEQSGQLATPLGDVTSNDPEPGQQPRRAQGQVRVALFLAPGQRRQQVVVLSIQAA